MIKEIRIDIDGPHKDKQFIVHEIYQSLEDINEKIEFNEFNDERIEEQYEGGENENEQGEE